MCLLTAYNVIVTYNSHSVSNQVEELRLRVRELEERERKESKKLADEDALRKIRVAEETIEHLQKKLVATKQVSVCFIFWKNIVACKWGQNRMHFCIYLALYE